jgi:hypothetical protein
MCLIIDRKKHILLRPKISLFPIKVYKILYTNLSGELITPYMGYQINFINKKCVLSAKFNIINDFSAINEGIHAYYKFHIAKSDVNDLYKCKIYKAIIPPFTKYFYGIKGEIVAEKMIIKECVL